MLKYWLWLTERPGLTNQVRLALLRHFGTPEAVYYADPEELLLTEGMTAAQVIWVKQRTFWRRATAFISTFSPFRMQRILTV